MAYLEPYLEVESGARVAGGVEHLESDSANDASVDKNHDSEQRVLRHGAAEVAVQVTGERRQGVHDGGRRRSTKKLEGATSRPRV